MESRIIARATTTEEITQALGEAAQLLAVCEEIGGWSYATDSGDRHPDGQWWRIPSAGRANFLGGLATDEAG